MSEEERNHEEIIIIRRGHDDHDDHHGGAWKVAFADFMTALMAFFLVMWLINSSSEETKKAVASYFNPIKLTDRISNPKGLRTPKYGDVSDEEAENEEELTVISNSKIITIKGEGVAQTFDEKALFADPYALLAEISSGLDTEVKESSSEDQNDSRSSKLGLNGGEAHKDPFDPSSWNMSYDIDDNKNEMTKLDEQIDEQLDERVETPDLNEEAELKTEKKPDTLKKEINDESSPKENVGKKSTLSKLVEGEEIKDRIQEKHEKTSLKQIDEQAVKKPEDEDIESDSAQLQIMRKKVQEIVSDEGKNAPDVQIRGNQSGTVITLFDKSKSGMFDIGSARPSPEMVRIMKKIGELLSREKGKIIVGGHTDGRKYKSENYDNWRLSTARAHMAYHMLVRGGVPESRFEMISGFGAVKLAVPDAPFSPVNRRIEISLRVS